MTARLCDILRLFVRQCTLLKKGSVHSGYMQCILVKSNEFVNWYPILLIYSSYWSLLCCCSQQKTKCPGLWKFNSLLEDESFVDLITENYPIICRKYVHLTTQAETGIDWNGIRSLTFPYAQKNKENSAKNLERQSHALSHWRKKPTWPTEINGGQKGCPRRKIINIPEVDHVKRARVWAGVDEHQLPARHEYRGSDKHVCSMATKAPSVCVA